MSVSVADLGRLVKRKFPGFEAVPDEELGRLVRARCRPKKGPAGEGRSEPLAPAASVEQTTGPASQEGRTTPDAPGVGVEGSAAVLPELVNRVASRMSGTARRDPDLRGIPSVEVDLVITTGAERVVARVFQRTPKEASP